MIAAESYYGSPFEKFAHKFCYKNLWRVSHILGPDREDFHSQCALWFVECYNFYKGSVDSDALLMYMFKLWVSGQVHDMSRKDTNFRKVIKDTEVDYWLEENRALTARSHIPEPTTISDVNLVLKLDGASDELKQVLKIFIDAPKEVMETLRADCQSPCPKQFFKRIVSYLKIDQAKTPKLAKELQELLS